jgi:hypothetical protein
MIDNECLLSDSQDLSQTTGNYYSTYTYNMGDDNAGPGKGNPLYVNFAVDEAFVGAGASVAFYVIEEEDTTLDDSSTVLVNTKAIGVATLVAGYQFSLPVPAGICSKQYLGARYTISGATTTAGTVSAWISNQPQLNP